MQQMRVNEGEVTRVDEIFSEFALYPKASELEKTGVLLFTVEVEGSARILVLRRVNTSPTHCLLYSYITVFIYVLIIRYLHYYDMPWALSINPPSHQ